MESKEARNIQTSDSHLEWGNQQFQSPHFEKPHMGLTEQLGIHPPSSGNFHREHDDKSMDVWVQGSPFSNRWKLWWIMMI